MRTLLVSPLNSFPLNPSQVFFTHLTLSINYSLNLLRILRVVPEEVMVRSRIHKKRAPLVVRSLRSGVGAPVYNISLHHPRAEGLSAFLLA